MISLPDAIFIIDVGYESGAVEEAKKLGIPIIGVVDTNNSVENINYVIPGNDDSSRAIRLYLRGMADSILDGKNKAIEDLAKIVAEEKAADDKDNSTSSDEKTS
jgi:small subunit ribosomal protein S2